MKPSLFTPFLLLVGASCQGASERRAFLSSRHCGGKSLLAPVVGLPRGGRSAPAKKEVSPTGFQKLKEACKKEFERPQDGSSRALVSTILLYIGAMYTVYAMNILQKIYVTDVKFWSGAPLFGRSGARTLCKENKSILFDFPSTVSETLADQNGIANIVAGSYLTFTALLVLASKIGNPSVFPIPRGHYRAIFNTLRMLAPVFATFFIPRVSATGDGYGIAPTWAQAIESGVHGQFGLASFALAPLFELISATLELISFFGQRPFGSKFLPSYSSSDDDNNNGRFTIVTTFYKSLWVVATVARALLAVVILYIVFGVAFPDAHRFNPAYGMPPQIDACGSLRAILTFINEKSFIGMIGGMYVALAISQMCESSGQKISSLLYILPLLAFGSKGVCKHVSAYIMSFDIKKNYLELLSIPSSGFWSDQDPTLRYIIGKHDEKWTEDLAGCTALLDLKSVPDDCFELSENPQ